MTWGVIAVEALLVIGVWIPSVRVKAVVIGILFHLAIEFSMNLFVFQWLMILVLATHLVTHGDRKIEAGSSGEG